jgi:hypothetical protein
MADEKIEIGTVGDDEVTGWVRYVEFTYKGEQFEAHLSWQEEYGYDLMVRKGDESILQDYAGTKDNPDEGIKEALDRLTFEVNKA